MKMLHTLLFTRYANSHLHPWETVTNENCSLFPCAKDSFAMSLWHFCYRCLSKCSWLFFSDAHANMSDCDLGLAHTHAAVYFAAVKATRLPSTCNIWFIGLSSREFCQFSIPETNDKLAYFKNNCLLAYYITIMPHLTLNLLFAFFCGLDSMSINMDSKCGWFMTFKLTVIN